MKFTTVTFGRLFVTCRFHDIAREKRLARRWWAFGGQVEWTVPARERRVRRDGEAVANMMAFKV